MMLASRQPLPLPPQTLPPPPPPPPPKPKPPQEALPDLERGEIQNLGRAKLRKYLGLMGESTFGNPEELKARILRYFEALEIDTYRPT